MATIEDELGMFPGFLDLKPVFTRSQFLNREKVFKRIVNYVAGRTTPQSCVVYGESKIGKTSLLLFLANEGPDDGGGVKSHGDIVGKRHSEFAAANFLDNTSLIYVGLQGLSEYSSLAFWEKMIDSLAAKFTIDNTGDTDGDGEGAELSRSAPHTYNDLKQCIEDVLAKPPTADYLAENSPESRTKSPRRIVFLLDDIDVIFEHLDESVLNNLRQLSSVDFSENVAIIASTSTRIPDLYRRLNPPRDHAQVTVPFGSNAFHLELGLLDISKDELGDFVARAAREMSLDKADQADPTHLGELIYRIAGRHPYLIKISSEYLLMTWQEQIAQRADSGPTQFLEAVADELLWHLEGDLGVLQLCEGLFNRRSRDQKRVLEALATDPYLKREAVDPSLWRGLVRLGLIDDQTGRLFSEIFETFVREKAHAEGRSLPETVRPDPGVPHTKPEAKPPMYVPRRSAILVGDELRSLTPVLNRLMAYLVEKTGTMCTREELWRNVWGSHGSIMVVEKGVNRLRAAVEDDPKRPRYIISIRGQGYLLNPLPVEGDEAAAA